MPSSSKSAKELARRARVEQLQRAQRAKDRRRTLLIIAALVGVVIAIGAVVVVVVLSGDSSTSESEQIIPASPSGSETAEQSSTSVPDTSGIPGVLAWSTEGYPGDGKPHPGALTHEHVPGPVKYAIVPPVGGPHSSVWLNAGVYTEPVPSELAVHDLEHGAVWIVYDQTLSDDKVAQLTEFVHKQKLIPESVEGVADQANRYLTMSPWVDGDLPTPIVISAWGHQLQVTSPTDPRLQQFVDTFRNNQNYSPEYGSAVDGVPVQSGGLPASDGSRQPNPQGELK